MKTTLRGLLALTLLLLPSAASGQATLIGTIGADSRTTPVSAAAPLPVTGAVTTTTTAQTGAGAVTATTARTVTATNSPDVTALGGITSILSTLTTAFAAPAAALPPLAILTGMSDGTFLRPLRARDLDTGAGTDYWQGVGLLLAGAGGGTPASAGAGAVDAGTIRATLGATDPAVVSLGLLDDTVRSTGDGSGKGLQLMVYDTATTNIQTPKMTNQALWANIASIGGNALGQGAGDSASGVLRTVEAGRPNADEPACTTATAGDAGNAHVIAARAGRRLVWVQIQGDADGQIRVARATTTGATCTTTAGVGTLLDAGTATTAGGYWEDSVGYSGAVAICVPTAGATVSYCYGEVY